MMTINSALSKPSQIKTPIHYHYDGEGRLIVETDGNTAETLREYMWLGLTPIATFYPNQIGVDEADLTSNTCHQENAAKCCVLSAWLDRKGQENDILTLFPVATE